MFIKAIINKKNGDSLCYGKIDIKDNYQPISTKVFTILQNAIRTADSQGVKMTENGFFYYQEWSLK